MPILLQKRNLYQWCFCILITLVSAAFDLVYRTQLERMFLLGICRLLHLRWWLFYCPLLKAKGIRLNLVLNVRPVVCRQFHSGFRVLHFRYEPCCRFGLMQEESFAVFEEQMKLLNPIPLDFLYWLLIISVSNIQAFWITDKNFSNQQSPSGNTVWKLWVQFFKKKKKRKKLVF